MSKQMRNKCHSQEVPLLSNKEKKRNNQLENTPENKVLEENTVRPHVPNFLIKYKGVKLEKNHNDLPSNKLRMKRKEDKRKQEGR